MRDKIIKALKGFTSLPGKYLDRVEKGFKEKDDYQRNRNTRIIIENFGSLDNYKKEMEDMPGRKRKGQLNAVKGMKRKGVRKAFYK